MDKTTSREEAEFAAALRDYFHRAGPEAARLLSERMAAASEEGCYREDHMRMLRQALLALPTRY